jgi:ABC-2 type transport system permease protein
VNGAGDLVNAVILTLAAAGVTAHNVELTSTTLEDAFVKLTGRPLESVPQAPSRGEGRRRQRPAARQRRPLLPAGTPRRAFVKLVKCESRLAWRQPIGLLFGLMLPVILLGIFGSIPSFRQPHANLGGISVLDAYVPVFIVFVLFAMAMFSLPTPLATYREQGILRRLSTTPVPPPWVLGAQLVISAGITVAALVILMVLATAGFGVKTPHSPGGFILAVALSGLAVLAMGLCIAGTARTAGAAGGLAALAFYPLMFFAGLFVPRQELPAVVRQIGDWTPLGAGVEALQRAMLSGFPAASYLLILAGYAAVFGWLAVRSFRWE